MRRRLHIDKQEINKRKGFTLIELLAVIVIITLISTISSYTFINMINNSKEKSLAMTKSNILKTASSYVNEATNIVWATDTNNSDNLISCVNIQELINMGYYTESILKNEAIKNDNINYIIVTKDATSKAIISEEFDKDGKCATTFKYVSMPNCNDLTYNGSPQSLFDETTNNNINFTDNSGTNAGSYNVNITPKKEYVWNDGTNLKKTKTCTIKKAKTRVDVDPNIAKDVSVDKNNYETTVKPILEDKRSDKKEIEGTITSKIIENNENAIINNREIKNAATGGIYKLEIVTKSIRNTNTTIKIIFTPKDSSNYESSSANYTIPSMNIDNIYTVTLDPNGGNFSGSTDPRKFLILKGQKYGNNLVTPTRIGYTFGGWHTTKDSNNEVTSNSTFNSSTNVILYAHWTRNFNCASKGGKTTYAGLQWTTISKTSTSCELALNGTSKTSGSYNSATTNLTNEYLTNGGSSYNSTMITEMNAGLLYTVNGNYYIDTNSGTSGNPAGNYWYKSEYVYQTDTYYNCNFNISQTTVYSGGRTSMSTGSQGLIKTKTGYFTAPSCEEKVRSQKVNNDNSSISYTGYSSTLYSTSQSLQYSTIFFYHTNDNKFRINYNGTTAGGNTSYNLYACGKSITNTDLIYIVYRCKPNTNVDGITVDNYNQSTTGTLHLFSNGRVYFYLAGTSSLNSNNITSSNCIVNFNEYTPKQNSVSLYYRPHIKVKL